MINTSSSIDAPYKTITMNLTNAAVGEHTNYMFNSFCKFNGIYYGADANGIYALTGDSDSNTAIDAEIKAGIWDFGSEFLKRVIDAWVGILGLGYYEITLVSDDGVETVYPLEGMRATPHNIKTNTARGVKGRYWQMRFKNVNGSDFKLESVTLNVDVLKRRVSV